MSVTCQENKNHMIKKFYLTFCKVGFKMRVNIKLILSYKSSKLFLKLTLLSKKFNIRIPTLFESHMSFHQQWTHIVWHAVVNFMQKLMQLFQNFVWLEIIPSCLNMYYFTLFDGSYFCSFYVKV